MERRFQEGFRSIFKLVRGKYSHIEYCDPREQYFTQYISCIFVLRAQKETPSEWMVFSFCLLLISSRCYRIISICSPTERAKAVGDEVAAVGISAARRGNPGHRKSHPGERRISTPQAEFLQPQCRWFELFRMIQTKSVPNGYAFFALIFSIPRTDPFRYILYGL